MGRGGRRRLLVVATVAALVGAVAPGPARAAGPPGRPAAKARARATTVTLLTGDRVVLRTLPGGRQAVTVTAAAGSGRTPSFQTWSNRRHTFVVPSDVRKLVGGVLDPGLFDVTALAGMGYDDARAPSLPLIVGHGRAGRAHLAAAALRPVRELASLHATAVRQPRGAAAGLGAELAAGPSAAGITHVWLDRPVHKAALDPNLTQIGAPAAWNAGLNGKGVRVAILDTGIDTTHPDLAGKVIAAADFSDSPGTTDRDGHGTHVAATVAGSGVKSGGRRKGVAFGASLLNGKVLDDFGFGTDSSVIAGMEWAAAHKARIANMSLGGGPTDGTDPLSQALDRITASAGTLFAVAAGNGGGFEQGVDTPGAADAALTVGAVDFDDHLADFSSRGPRLGDFAMKPDITAPGVDIIEARAAGTSLGEPVDQWYTRLSGTSMATPHVAGAAAILAQQHPTWPAARIKAVLMGTAASQPDQTVYEQGGGRLDVAHAIGQRLLADQVNLDFGYFKYPQTGVGPVTRPVRYSNGSSAPLTVDLGVDLRDQQGQPAPAGMATVTPARLTLPAGGSASAQVTVDIRHGPPGLYGGGVTATPTGGQPALHTPLGFYKEPERYDLKIDAIRRDGTPDTGGFDSVGIMNVDNGELFNDFRFLDEHGQVTVRVAPGHYLVVGFVTGAAFDSVSMVGNPELRVARDTRFTLDARKALPLTAAVAGTPTRPAKVDFGYTRYDQTGSFGNSGSFEVAGDLASGGVFAQPTRPVAHGQFEAESQWRLLPPGAASAGVSRRLHDLLFYGPTVPRPPAYRVRAADVPKLARIASRYYAANDHADYVEGRIGFAPLQFAGGTGLDPVAAPIRRVELLTPDPIVWDHFADRFADDADLSLFGFGPGSYPPGERLAESWFEAPLHPQAFGDRDATSMFLSVADLGDAGGHQGGFFEFSDQPVAKGATRLYRHGKLLASGTDPFLEATVRPAPARYRLERDLDVDGLLGLANVTHTRWWFTSGAPSGGGGAVLPLLEVDYRVSPLGGRDGLPAGHAATVDLDIHRLQGAPAGKVVAAHLWFSTDGGAHWTAVALHRLGPGRYRALLPARRLPAGRSVSLRVYARDAGDSRIDQRLLRAFPVR
ncbi:MAG TPA: S8 family serine peptidase [Actinomycetes bacterium]|nr:S8 family serine peptidase [Actinomycetes bacterium]